MKLTIHDKKYFGIDNSYGYRIDTPVQIKLMSGKRLHLRYNAVNETGSTIVADAEFKSHLYTFRIRDIYIYSSPQCIEVYRKIDGFCTNNPEGGIDGINIGFECGIDYIKQSRWRFCLPAAHYTRPEEISGSKLFAYMEDRLTASFAASFNLSEKKLYTLTKCSPARRTERPERRKGQPEYLQRTDISSLGYRQSNLGEIYLLSFWPYYEGEKSVALDSNMTSATAYFPLDGENIHTEMVYRLEIKDYESYSEGLCETFALLATDLDKDSQRLAELSFSTEDSIEYRIASLGMTYKEFGIDGAGFFFHFDPRYGYGSLPSGFGTSFNNIPHDSYAHILEYGFTGRQINAALIMAQNKGEEWIGRGIKVVDFFLAKCMTENGWLYSLYDLDQNAPFFSFGDPDAPKLHYISRTADRGNYLRTMAEPMNDVLECYRWYRKNNIEKPEWIKHIIKFANFLVRVQNEDGSWYRAYKPNGLMADTGGDGPFNEAEREKGQKAAAAIPVIFMCNVIKELVSQGLDSGAYERAVKKAGDYILDNFTNEEHYQGGTLDNPNIVDKEASQYVMAGLYHLYRLTGNMEYLKGADKAARIFVTWNYIWNAPMEPGTYLYKKAFRTKGCGGINSIWGGGVVDIYSLFHIEELYLIGKEMNKRFYCKMSEWISIGTQQILSCPQDDMGFAGVGMQPEGFGICNQGIDEGMISKGDIWGTLGWIYSAGIYGIKKYLKAKNNDEN